MENRTCFDLNAAVENWRRELAALPADAQRELETHLRDSLAGLKSRGLNEEESFWLASRRLGRPQQIAEEFDKADPAQVWRERMFWMWLGIFLLSVFARISNSLALAVAPTHLRSGTSPVFILQAIMALAPVWIPLILTILLVRGKIIRPLARLTGLTQNRWRLAAAAIICAIGSSVTYAVSWSKYLLHSNLPSEYLWQILIQPSCYSLIVGTIMVWLLPAPGGKRPRRT